MDAWSSLPQTCGEVSNIILSPSCMKIDKTFLHQEPDPPPRALPLDPQTHYRLTLTMVCPLWQILDLPLFPATQHNKHLIQKYNELWYISTLLWWHKMQRNWQKILIIQQQNTAYYVYNKQTRKLSYRIDDGAMRPMYGRRQKFSGVPQSLTMPTATFPEIFNGLLFWLSL